MNKTKKYYDTWALQYDENINPTRDLDRQITIETLSGIKFSYVLELGCGTGKNTEWLIKIDDTVTGLDFSDGMLDLARQKMSSENVSFIKADLNEQWSVQNNTFDLVTINLTLEHIENLDHIFRSVNETLDLNGHCFVSELHPKKQLAGSKARFEEQGSEKVLDVFLHMEQEYINSAEKAELQLIHQKDWYDDETEMPRLISFLFQKTNN